VKHPAVCGDTVLFVRDRHPTGQQADGRKAGLFLQTARRVQAGAPRRQRASPRRWPPARLASTACRNGTPYSQVYRRVLHVRVGPSFAALTGSIKNAGEPKRRLRIIRRSDSGLSSTIRRSFRKPGSRRRQPVSRSDQFAQILSRHFPSSFFKSITVQST
jgi:hypothetical protein